MTDPSHSNRFTLWHVIGTAASVAVVSAGAAWTAGRTLLGDELEQYRRADHWKAPDAIRKLDELSGRLNITMEERTRFETTARLAEERGKENSRLQKELAEKSRVLAEAQSRLKALEADTFDLEEGRSRFVIGQALAIGLRSMNPYTKECDVRLGDRKETMTAGGTLDASHGRGESTYHAR
jgi:hypothetical protein